jgi:hypothetical protein
VKRLNGRTAGSVQMAVDRVLRSTSWSVEQDISSGASRMNCFLGEIFHRS